MVGNANSTLIGDTCVPSMKVVCEGKYSRKKLGACVVDDNARIDM